MGQRLGDLLAVPLRLSLWRVLLLPVRELGLNLLCEHLQIQRCGRCQFPLVQQTVRRTGRGRVLADPGLQTLGRIILEGRRAGGMPIGVGTAGVEGHPGIQILLDQLRGLG